MIHPVRAGSILVRLNGSSGLATRDPLQPVRATAATIHTSSRLIGETPFRPSRAYCPPKIGPARFHFAGDREISVFGSRVESDFRRDRGPSGGPGNLHWEHDLRLPFSVGGNGYPIRGVISTWLEPVRIRDPKRAGAQLKTRRHDSRNVRVWAVPVRTRDNVAVVDRRVGGEIREPYVRLLPRHQIQVVIPLSRSARGEKQPTDQCKNAPD